MFCHTLHLAAFLANSQQKCFQVIEVNWALCDVLTPSVALPQHSRIKKRLKGITMFNEVCAYPSALYDGWNSWTVQMRVSSEQSHPSYSAVLTPSKKSQKWLHSAGGQFADRDAAGDPPFSLCTCKNRSKEWGRNWHVKNSNALYFTQLSDILKSHWDSQLLIG